MSKILKAFKNPKSAIKYFKIKSLVRKGDKISDEKYLRAVYKCRMGKKLDLNNPRTFNEKLQWLKLNNRTNDQVTFVDKYKVRDYISEVLGEEYLIPLLGVWDSPEDIDFDSLPDKFVLKCNHNSGLGMCICKSKQGLDIEKVKSELAQGLAQNYYLHGREWPYKNVERKIICEKFMSDSSGGLVDYKFFCFDGKVDCVMVCLDRHLGDTKFYFFDENWTLKRLNIRGKNAPEGFTVPKPECMDRMFEIAAKLSVGHPFVRVDLYECDNRIYFGELTFYPDSGFDENLLEETDEYFGKKIDLSLAKKENNN